MNCEDCRKPIVKIMKDAAGMRCPSCTEEIRIRQLQEWHAHIDRLNRQEASK